MAPGSEQLNVWGLCPPVWPPQDVERSHRGALGWQSKLREGRSGSHNSRSRGTAAGPVPRRMREGEGGLMQGQPHASQMGTPGGLGCTSAPWTSGMGTVPCSVSC